MPFDPNVPINGAIVDADLLRNQFTSLKSLIDAVPTSPPGPDGSQGLTGAPGPAGAQGIQGLPGANGDPGPQGDAGAQGEQGPQGDAGPEGRHVTNVYDSGDGRAIIEMSDATTYGPFTVASGPAGADGAQGPEGPMGPSGEVSAQQLSDAIAGTPSNVNGIEPMSLTVSDPPTQWEMQTIANKLDELINALKRW